MTTQKENYDKYVDSVKRFVAFSKKHESECQQIADEYANSDKKLHTAVSEFESNIRSVYKKNIEQIDQNLFNQNRILDEYASLKNGQLSESDKTNIKKMREAIKKIKAIDLAAAERMNNENQANLAQAPDLLKQQYKKEFEEAKEQKLAEYKSQMQNFLGNQTLLFDSRFATAGSKSQTGLWEELQPKDDVTPSPYVTIGTSELKACLFDKVFVTQVYHLVPFLNSRNLLIRCNSRTKRQALQLADMIILRYCVELRNLIRVLLADTVHATRDLGDLKKMDEKIRGKFITEPRDVQETLLDVKKHINNISIKLTNSTPDLLSFNATANVKQAYNILYLSNFVNDLKDRNIDYLASILRNDTIAGVTALFVLDKDEADVEIAKDEKSAAFFNEVERYFHVLDISSNDLALAYGLDAGNFKYEDETKFEIERIIETINDAVVQQVITVLSFKDQMLPQSQWWQESALNGVNIPIGVIVEENNKQLVTTFHIEQENTSAIVVGSPGTGKSSLFHTLICNIITHYSPEEVELYLVDLKDVEFSDYARLGDDGIITNPIPHVKITASSAEREFATNAISELWNEGTRRKNLFVEAGVNNYVSYRKTTGKKLPQIILIIDEFLRIFETYDDISTMAEKQIRDILLLYRMCGIHLIFACQTLKNDAHSLNTVVSMLPIRYVYKCADRDADELLKMATKDMSKIFIKGQFIYNDNFGGANKGNEYVNKFCQSYFVTDDYRKSLIQDISNYSRQQGYGQETIVYIPDEKAFIEKCNFCNEHNDDVAHTKETEIFVGKSVDIKISDVFLKLRSESGSNLCVIGGLGSDAPYRIVTNAIVSAMMNYKDRAESEFYIFNGINSDDEKNHYKPSEYFENHSKFRVTINADISDTLAKLVETINTRLENKQANQAKIFAIFYAVEQINTFKTDPMGIMDNFREILSNGSLVGVHVILQINSWSNFTKYISSADIDCFNHRIALQMNPDESYSYIKSSAASILNKYEKMAKDGKVIQMGYYYRDGFTQLIKFKIYEYPDLQWVKQKTM
jgi:hypothetical protein